MKNCTKFTNEAKRLPTLIYDKEWENFRRLKKESEDLGDEMAGTFQLFVPRPSILIKRIGLKETTITNKNRQIEEVAPIFPGVRLVSQAGDSKPKQAFWTSTAIKVENNTYTSDWNDWVLSEMPSWSSSVGYLYKVRSGCSILALRNDKQIKRVFKIFQALSERDTSETFPDVQEPNSFRYYIHLLKYFPWTSISRNFDAVHHKPGFGYMESQFLYGWDVESTAWFKMTESLFPMGQVRVQTNRP